ncbi:MAG: hypothetical protein RPU34_05880 [Candidatus Sedimenticola sp. (ex Thyasira tokunagai)]
MAEALIGLLGVVVGAFIAGAREYWIAKSVNRKSAEYLAIRVVSVLDGFVEGCAEVVGDDGLYHGQAGPDGCRSVQVSTPEFSVESLDVDWKSIPSSLMYEILSLPNRVSAADQRIDGALEYVAGPPDYEELFEERQIQYGELGLKAASLSDELRKAYGVPAREYLDWDPVQHITEGKGRAIAERNERNARSEELWHSMQQKS